MIHRYTIIAILLLCSTIVTAEEARLEIGQPFLSARHHLIGHGWRPKKSGPSERIGIEQILARKGIVENESCSVDGEGYCIFNYKRKQQCLQLFTAGEELKSMHVTNPRKA